MTKKDYLEPSVEVIEIGYRDPVCQAMSGTGGVPDYDPITNPGFNAPGLPGMPGLF